MVTTSETPATDNDDSFWTDLRSRTVEWHDAIRGLGCVGRTVLYQLPILYRLPMKLPDNAHFSRQWRIHGFTRDFRFEGVWALPTPGMADDFPRLVQTLASFDEARQPGSLVGKLFAMREALGRVFGWDKTVDDPSRPSLRHRLPLDLRDFPSTVTPPMGLTPLYQIDDEWAAELINRTVHGVIHLGWAQDGAGNYRGQMTMLVKPNGLLGRAYLAAITPFRYLIIYPRLLRWMDRKWLSYNDDRS
jgi:hypothetical protein